MSGMLIAMMASGAQDRNHVKHCRSIDSVEPTISDDKCFYQLDDILLAYDEIHEWWFDFNELPYTLKLFYEGKLNELMHCGDLRLSFINQNVIVFDEIQFNYARLCLPRLNLNQLPKMNGKLFFNLGLIEKKALSHYLCDFAIPNKDLMNIVADFGIEFGFAPKLQLHVGMFDQQNNPDDFLSN